MYIKNNIPIEEYLSKNGGEIGEKIYAKKY